MSALCVLGGILAVDSDVPSTEPDRRVDWIGAFLVTAGVVLILFVLGQGQLAPHGWRTPCESALRIVWNATQYCSKDIIASLVIGVVLIVAFIFWEHRLETKEGLRPPLMKLTLWTRARGRFAVIQIIAFLEWSAFLSWYFWVQVRFVPSDPSLPSIVDNLLPRYTTRTLLNLPPSTQQSDCFL
jgi:hypothetical protein